MTTSFITGWDIGGAHLKVARCDQHGQLLSVLQIACPLWKGISYLQHAIQSVQAQLNNQHDRMAVTMTGELVDIFPNRQCGVTQIIDCLASFFSEEQIHIYASKKTWLSPQKAKEDWLDVASQNWHASALFAAQQSTNGVLIDLGSTTCDIITFANGQITTCSSTDHQRQAQGELLYTGAIRTPLIALCDQAPFNGQLISLAAEVFATTGDVWCLLDQLDPLTIQDQSADGQPWSKKHCAQRIARLIGCDVSSDDLAPWQQLARWFAEQHLHQINKAYLQVLSQHVEHIEQPIIGAGVGRFIIQQIANRLGQRYIDFDQLCSASDISAADHAPAAAVALLAQQQFA